MTYESENKKIPYGGPLHAKILPLLQERITRGREAIITRAEQWTKNEEQFLAYIPVSENDKLRQAAKKGGQPQYTTIEIPYSYAILLTAHTYITSVFMARSPVLQMQGRHGEAQQSETAIEALLDYQVQTGGHLVPMYIWTLDAFKYGTGIMGYYWDEEKIRTRKRSKKPRTFLGLDVPKTERVVEEEEVTRGYVGTRAYNVRPADFITDPSFPVNQFQKGEFCARYVELSWLDIVDGSTGKDACYFNFDALKGNRRDQPAERISGSDQVILPGMQNNTRGLNLDFATGMVDAYEIYVRLVPADWGLGNSRQSEKWVFTLASNAVIIGARPLGYYHNRFPFEVLETEIDGHGLFARSMLEVMQPLNDTLTWLINTHFFNVRKSLNDQFVVDPSRIVMKDMTDPNPGRIVRLKPDAYGTDVRTAVQQMQVADVTRAHMTDAQIVGEMIQRVVGVNDSLMGVLNSGRKTATEVRSSTTFGINRMKTTTEYMSAMGFSPWAQQICQVTQQLFDDDRKFKIVGDLAEMGEKFMTITPEQIAGFYDFTPIDGTLPVDRFAQVNLWKMLMEQAMKMPQVAVEYDFIKIFGFVAQLAGLKNISQFRIKVVPNAVAAGNAAAGNSIPLGPTPNAREGVSEPGQMPGMGQTS